jgi:hypothetical protein
MTGTAIFPSPSTTAHECDAKFAEHCGAVRFKINIEIEEIGVLFGCARTAKVAA